MRAVFICAPGGWVLNTRSIFPSFNIRVENLLRTNENIEFCCHDLNNCDQSYFKFYADDEFRGHVFPLTSSTASESSFDGAIPSANGSAWDGKFISATRVAGSHVPKVTVAVHPVEYGKGAVPLL